MGSPSKDRPITQKTPEKKPVPPKVERSFADYFREWVAANPDEAHKLIKEEMGIQIVTPEELLKKKTEVDEIEEAAKELGSDLESRASAGQRGTQNWVEFIDKVHKQVQLLYRSHQWKNNMSPSEKYGLYAVLVFIRQMKGENPPPNEPATLYDLIRATGKIPAGSLNLVGIGYPGKRKSPRLTEAHLQAAGITPKPDLAELKLE